MNLFDVHTGCKSLGAKPRNATQNEVRAYLKWIAARQGVTVPANAEYHPAGIWSPSAREYIVEMPGHGQKQIVTCERLAFTLTMEGRVNDGAMLFGIGLARACPAPRDDGGIEA